MINTQPPPPYTNLQRLPTLLGESPEHILHLDGVRWDIAKGADGKLLDEGVFSDAFVDTSKVKDVYLCTKQFMQEPGGLPGHAILEFEFQPEAAVTNSQGAKDVGLAISMEAHMYQGQKWLPTITNPVVYQIDSFSDALLKANVHDHDPITRYRLQLSHDQQVSLLREKLQTATADHLNDHYNGVSNSCLTTIVDSLNKVLPDAQKIARTLPDGTPDPQTIIPVWCSKLFYSHGLFTQDKPDIFPAR